MTLRFLNPAMTFVLPIINKKVFEKRVPGFLSSDKKPL